MVAINATNSTTPSLQAALGRAKLQQARQEAEQAENNAQRLREQADAAEQDVQKSQAKVRTVAAQNQRDTAVTYTASQEKNTSEVPTATQDFLVRLYSATSQKRSDSGNALKSDPSAAPVINSQGQSTGRIVNIHA